jgi:uncharacterized protein with HEPN domain
MSSDADKKDLVRIRHMLDSVVEGRSFLRGKLRSDLESDRMLTLALIKEIEILGEAAGRVSEKFKSRYAQIPWSAIIATRNRLIHGYFDIDLDVVWKTVSEDLPTLQLLLEDLLGKPREKRA